MRRLRLLAELFALLFLGGCGGVTVGPYWPDPPVLVCSGPADCPDHTECKFLAVDTRAVCVRVPEGDESW